jgi:hypothetical protein
MGDRPASSSRVFFVSTLTVNTTFYQSFRKYVNEQPMRLYRIALPMGSNQYEYDEPQKLWIPNPLFHEKALQNMHLYQQKADSNHTYI